MRWFSSIGWENTQLMKVCALTCSLALRKVLASFTIFETINHMLERASKVFGCFLDLRKAFDTVWIDFSTGSLLSRKFDVLQGTGQGRILARLMYKVYINSLLDSTFLCNFYQHAQSSIPFFC